VEKELDILLVGILVDVIDPSGVKLRGAALDAVHLVAFLQQQLREVGPILPRDAGNECNRTVLAVAVLGDFARDLLFGRHVCDSFVFVSKTPNSSICLSSDRHGPPPGGNPLKNVPAGHG
jgi:hypothetical protein